LLAGIADDLRLRKIPSLREFSVPAQNSSGIETASHQAMTIHRRFFANARGIAFLPENRSLPNPLI